MLQSSSSEMATFICQVVYDLYLMFIRAVFLTTYVLSILKPSCAGFFNHKAFLKFPRAVLLKLL